MKSIFKRSGIVTLLFAVMVSLALIPACPKKENGAAGKTKKTVKKEKTVKPDTGTTPITPVAEAAPEEEKEIYSYSLIRRDGQRKRDPFTPIRVVTDTPLTRYDISQMGVDGVIIHGVKTANVRTPDGRSTKIGVGVPIGIHNGVVVDISLDGIAVNEKYLDVRGRIQEYERFISNKPYKAKRR